MSSLSRPAAFADLPDPAVLRRLVEQIRQHTLKHLDMYLQELAETVTAQGGRVHLVTNARAARGVFGKLLRDSGVASVLLQDAPLCREMVGLLQARRFERAQGQSGVVVTSPAFAIAETGQICLIDDGSSKIASDAIVAVMWLDQIVPRLADLGVVLKLISRDALGSTMPPRVRLLGGDLASFDLILVARTVEASWVGRLLQRLSRYKAPSPAEEDWLATLGRSFAPTKQWECWERRS